MHNFCYCVGGTGARVAEAAAHLCAANMIEENERVTFIIVDKDTDCGGTMEANATIDAIKTLCGPAAEGGLECSAALGKEQVRQFCASRLDRNKWSFKNALGLLVNDTLQDGVNDRLRNIVPKNKDDETLLNAFFSAEEQEKSTVGGFYGHPSIGSLLFNYMVTEGRWDEEQDAGDIAKPVVDYLKNNQGEKTKVFVIGSIFGGTGAAIFSNLAAYIKKKAAAEEIKSNRLYMGGVLLLPYFGFPTASGAAGGMEVKSADFYKKSKVALEQYGNDRNLIKTEGNPNGVFDLLYVVGQDPPYVTAGHHNDSGSGQKNHFTLIDLVAAKAMVEFFNVKPREGGAMEFTPGGESKIKEYRFSAAKENEVGQVKWEHLPGMKKNLTAMLAFSTFMITQAYASFYLNRDKPYDNRMVRRLYGTTMVDRLHRPKHEYDEVKQELKACVEKVFNYCDYFVKFANDMAKNGKNWADSNDDGGAAFQLFNKDLLKELRTLCDTFKAAPNAYNMKTADTICVRLNSAKDFVPGDHSGSTCEQIAGHLVDVFGEGRRYGGTNVSATQRAADYIHEVFKYCLENA